MMNDEKENTMNIDDLTIKQARELIAMFGTAQTGAPSSNPMIGRHVIARTFTAGVHIGTVASQHGEETYLLVNSRRLWKWDGAFTLSEVATLGLNPKGSRIAVEIPQILLTNVNELIPTSDVARKTFEATHEKA